MVFVGLTVVAPPPAHAVADAVVSGTVVDSLMQQPLASVTVSDSTSGRSTTTGAQGTYSLSLPAGDHVLTATIAGYAPASTPKLTLSAGQTLSTQVFTLQQYASASGMVTEKGTTTGISPVVVKFFDASSQSPNPDFAATTGPDGSWTIDHVAPGTYRVQFDGTGTGYASQWYETASTRDSAAAVTLVAGEKRSIGSALSLQTVTSTSTTVTPSSAAQAPVTAQSTASLSGHVTIDPGGTPAAGASVRAIAGSGASYSVTTDDTGGYSFTGIPADYYRVSAAGANPPALPAYLGGAVSYPLATYLLVTGGAALVNQDIHLPLPATLSGTVTNRGGPIAGIPVSFTGMGLQVGTRSLADGSFAISRIPPGTYRLSANSGNEDVWWSGTSDVGAATQITVQAADNLTGYSIAVPPRYLFSGTVRTAAGTPMTTGQIELKDANNTWSTYLGQTGTYSLELNGGTYELGYQYQDGSVDWSPGSTTQDLLTISADTVKNITLPGDLSITLPVTGADGSVPSTVGVSAYDVAHYGYSKFKGATSSNGSLSLSLPPGDFRLEVSAPNYRPWSAQVTVSSSMTIPVTLDLGGKLAGTVSGPAAVTAINTTTGEKFNTQAPSGPYSFAGLSAGDYVVTAAPLSQWGYQCGWAGWLGGNNYLNAHRVPVAEATSADGLDFDVECEASWTSGGELLGQAVVPVTLPETAYGTLVSATNSVGSVRTMVGYDGTFDFHSLTPGTYEISAYASALGLEAHSTITIAPGITTILALNLTPRGRVTGRILSALEAPVHAKVSNAETEVSTDDQGNFTLGGISYGPQTLKVVPESPYAVTFVDVTVGSGADTVLTIHASLASQLGGQLSSSAGRVAVTVTDASGRVIASDYFGYSFTFTGLQPGPVKVRFSGSQIMTEWWRDAPDEASATPIDLPAGSGVLDVSPSLGLTPTTAQSTTISGLVTFAGGPLGGVAVSTTVGSSGQATTTTASDGAYSLTVPRGETYSVKAQVCLGPVSTVCTGQDYAEARSVVADQATAPGVDFVVPEPANSFTVAPQPVVTGRPISGETLTAGVGEWSPAPDSTSWQWYADGSAIYQATGATLTLTDDQVGTQIQVVVTQAKAGYATITLPSEPTDVVEVPGAIHALTPSRLLDSRTGQGGFTGPAKNGTVITLPVWGKGGVPQGASAVLVNLTATEVSASGFVTAYASGTTAPWVSNSNPSAGVTSANLSLVPVGADGAIAIKTTLPGSVQIIADVQGYVVGGTVAAAGAVVPVTPTRVLDTRQTHHVAAMGTITIPVAGVAGVPADSTAVVANITVTGPGASGYLTAWPTGVSRPTASNVNFLANQTVPNLAIVKVGDNRSISIFSASSAPVDLVVDIQGYVTPGTPTLTGTVVPVTPTRVVDTRLNQGGEGPVGPNDGIVVDFMPTTGLSDVPQGALINLTVTEPRAPGWLAVYPSDVDLPLVSNLNFTAGMVVPNLSLATLNDGYAVIYDGSSGTVQIVADVLAYLL